MADVMRKVKDFRADPAGIREFAVDASVQIEIGDLVWLDGDDVKPASSTGLWTGGIAGTLGNLAHKFAGVAMSALNSTAAGFVRVATRGVFKFTVTTGATFEVGNLISGSRNGSNNYLHDQQVDKLTDNQANQGSAIGRVTKRETVSTTQVEFEILSSVAPGGGSKAFLTS